MVAKDIFQLFLKGAIYYIPKNEWNIADEIYYEETGSWPFRYTDKAKSVFSPFPHGWIVAIVSRPFHYVYIYEDGFEEWENIGD